MPIPHSRPHASSNRPGVSPVRRGVAAITAVVCLVVAGGSTPGPVAAFAQSCGGCAGPGVGGGGAQRSWLGEGGASFRFSFEYESKDRSWRGRDRVVNDFDETLRSHRTSFDVRYGVTDDWTLSLGLHHPHYRYRVKPPGGERSTSVFRGPGDTTVLLGRRFTLADAPAPLLYAEGPLADAFTSRFRTLTAPTLQVWAGVSVPTGTAEEPNVAFVRRDVSVANLQTGTGTWDPVLRLRFDVPGETLRPYAQADLRVPLTENRHDYWTGRSLSFTAGAETDLLPDVRASLAVTWQRVERDTFDGDRVGVGGAQWIYVTPGIAWDVSPQVTVDASVRLVAMRDTETKLSDGSTAVQVGITYRF